MNYTNYEIDLGHRVTCLHISLLRLWNERENETTVNVIIVEEGEDVEEIELPLIDDAERDSGELIIGERLTVQQRGQLLDLLEECKDIFTKSRENRRCQS